MRFNKIIKEYGHDAGCVTFFKEDCLISGLRMGDSIEVTYLKIAGAESAILLNHNYIRKVIKRGILSVSLVFPAEVMQILGLRVDDVIEFDCNIIKPQVTEDKKEIVVAENSDKNNLVQE